MFVTRRAKNAVADKVYTPDNIAKLIISKVPLSGKVLDPFKGKGAFYNNLPDNVNKDWCEIDEGRDFFNFTDRVDWIISNPPYSEWNRVIEHSYQIADNIVYLIPLSKLVGSWGRCKDILKYGGVKYLFILPAGKCGFPFGFPACAVWFQRDYKGTITVELFNESE